jgi:DNA-binding IclR family transcriptional regulator
VGAETGGASFLRGLNVLITIAESGEARADEIAAELGVPLSTVYRYLRALRELDLIEERDRSYVPGWRLLELAGLDVARTRLVELGHAVLRDVTEATGETAVLTVRAGTRALCLRQVESHHPVRMAFRIGQLLPLYAGAGQRMLLAHAPPAVIERVFEQPQCGPPTGRCRPARSCASLSRSAAPVTWSPMASCLRAPSRSPCPSSRKGRSSAH